MNFIMRSFQFTFCFISLVFYLATPLYNDTLIKNDSVIKSFKIYSKSVKDTFQIDISFPKSYNINTTQKYPVLYLTDGYWRKNQHRTIHDMSNKKLIREIVIVGIGYPESYNPDIIRKRDLIKNADKFLNFICDELIPLIEKKYRVTNERTLWGSSFGGFFGLYALFNYPDKTRNIFNNYIIASPATKEKTFYENRYIDLFAIEKILSTKTNELNVNLYLAVGSNEDIERFLNPFKELVKILERRNYRNFNMKSFIDPGKDHYTVWEPALYEGLKLFWGNK